MRPMTTYVPVTRTQRPSRRSAGQAGLRPLAPGPAPCRVLGAVANSPGAPAPLRNECYCKMAFPPALRASARLHLKARCSGQARSRGFPPRPQARRRLSLPLRRMGSRPGFGAAGRLRPPGVGGGGARPPPARRCAPAPSRRAGARAHRPRPGPAPRAHLHAAAAPPGAAKATCPCPPWAAPSRAAADLQVTGGGGSRWARGERTEGRDLVGSGWGVGHLWGGRPRGRTGGCGRLWPLSTSDRGQLPHVHSASGPSVFPACVTSSGRGSVWWPEWAPVH